MIKIDKSELDRFVVYLKTKDSEDTKRIHKVLKNSGMAIQRNAMTNLEKNGSVQTGHLRRSIANYRRGMTITIHTSNVKYAICVEKGTKAHIIRPKNKKALYWKGATRPVKYVNHPGSKAKPYLEPAFEQEKDKFVENLKEAIKW